MGRRSAPLPFGGHVVRDIIGGFESTYLPAHDTDVMETTRHDTRWRDDFELLRGMGVRRLRYPVRWHRVEAAAGT